MAESVHSELIDTVYVITLDRPKVNALDLEMVNALRKAFETASREPMARAVLLRGAGDTFSGGQDIYEMLKAEGISYRKHMLETYNPLVIQIRQLNLPVLAEVIGTTTGAALGLVLACDLRIASEDARLVVGFLGLGLAPDTAVSLFLPALTGLGRATEVAFTNQPISAEQALCWGMVNYLFPSDTLHASAFKIDRAIASGPIHAMGLTKRDFNKAICPQLEQILDYEAHIQEVARSGAEHKEGVSAFVEKRIPNWLGC